MTRPDRVTRLIRLIAVREAMTITTNNKHRAALHALSVGIINDLSDKDHERISKVRRHLAQTARELVIEWAEDTA